MIYFKNNNISIDNNLINNSIAEVEIDEIENIIRANLYTPTINLLLHKSFIHNKSLTINFKKYVSQGCVMNRWYTGKIFVYSWIGNCYNFSKKIKYG